MGPLVNSLEGYRSTIVYTFIYAIMSVGLLLIFIYARREDGYSLLYLTDFRGFGQAS